MKQTKKKKKKKKEKKKKKKEKKTTLIMMMIIIIVFKLFTRWQNSMKANYRNSTNYIQYTQVKLENNNNNNNNNNNKYWKGVIRTAKRMIWACLLCDIHKEQEKCIHGLVGSNEGKRPPGSSRRKWKYWNGFCRNRMDRRGVSSLKLKWWTLVQTVSFQINEAGSI